MRARERREGVVYLGKFTSRKDKSSEPRLEEATDSLSAWVGRYLEPAVVGMRSRTVAEKAALHLGRFVSFFGGPTVTIGSRRWCAGTCRPGSGRCSAEGLPPPP
jgi:hypothetical protein